MADTSGSAQSSSTNSEGGNEEKEKEKRLFELMERLRGRSGQSKSWADFTKAMRGADKSRGQGAVEMTQSQCHLMRLQRACSVSSAAMLCEHLESMATLMGLRYVNNSGTEAYVSSEMFYVSLYLDASGRVTEAKIANNGEPVPCPELVKSIREAGIKALQSHLEGLSAMYHINCDKKQRQKCCQALQALEEDLRSLGHIQESISPQSQSIHKSPLGLIQRRVGGRPMRLTYFAHPYDLLDPDSKSSHPLTPEGLGERQVGHSVTISLQNSTPHKLQTMPLMVLQKQDGKNIPVFSDLSSVNCSVLPAVFSLQLSKPMAVSLSVLKRIQTITGLEVPTTSEAKPLLSLLINQVTQEPVDHIDPSKGVYVTLPDQNHCYFMNPPSSSAKLLAVVATSIPFRHPICVSAVLALLRQQALFNTLITSCIRKNPIKDLSNSLTFEVNLLSLQSLIIMFEHPLHDTVATAEFDLSDITNVRCQICSTEEPKICKEEYSCQVLQRCLSLPVTMRAILRQAASSLHQQPLQPQPPLHNLITTVPNATLSAKGHERRLAFLEAHGYHDNRYPPPNRLMPPPEPDMQMGQNLMPIAMQRGDYDPRFIPPGMARGMASMPNETYGKQPMEIMEQQYYEQVRSRNDMESFTKVDKISQNPMLASLLETDVGTPTHDVLPSAMFSSVLDSSQHLMSTKQRRVRKRKNTAELRSPSSVGRSPKRKTSEDEHMPIPLDSPSPKALGSEPPLRSMSMPNAVPNRSLTKLLSDESPTHGPESHVSRLASSMDILFKQEPTSSPTLNADHTPLLMETDNGFRPTHAKGDRPVKPTEDKRRISTASSLIELLEDSDSQSEMPAEAVLKNRDRDSGRSSLSNSACSTPVGGSEKGGGGGGGAGSRLTNDASVFDFKPEPMNPGVVLAGKLSSSGTEGSPPDPSPVSSESPPPFPSPKLTNNTPLCNSTPPHKPSTEHKQSPDIITIDEKPKDISVKIRKEKRDKEEEIRPPEQKKITMKLSTKDLSAKTIVKDLVKDNSNESVDFTKIKSKDSPKNYKDKVFDLTSDSDGSSSLIMSRPLLSTDNSKPCSPSLKIKKIRSEDRDKKRKSSKHGDYESSKRRREESRKDKSAKKHRTYVVDSDFGSSKSPGQRYAVEKGPTTITIKKSVPASPSKTNKINSSQTSSSSSSSAPTSSSSSSLHKNAVTKPDRLSLSSQSRSNKYSSKSMGRSKSESHGPVSKVDSKLIRTPTIKLKPVVIPGSSSTVNVSTTSGKTPPPPQTPPAVKTPEQVMPNKTNKFPPMKARKNSLSAVIDKLTKQQTPSSGSSLKKEGDRRDNFDRKDTSLPIKKDSITDKNKLLQAKKDPISDKNKFSSIKKDPLAEKKKLEEIRKEIIRQGSSSSISTGVRPTKLAVDSSTKRSDPNSKAGTPTGSSSLKFTTSLNRSLSGSKPPSQPIPKVSNPGDQLRGDASRGESSRGESSRMLANNKDSSARTPGEGRTKSPGVSSGPPPQTPSSRDNREPREGDGKRDSKDPNFLTNCLHSTPPLLVKDTGENVDRDKMGKALKYDDNPDRLAMRHFLDAVSCSVNKIKDGDKDPRKLSKDTGDPRLEKSKHNGVVGRVGDCHDMVGKNTLDNHMDNSSKDKNNSAMSEVGRHLSANQRTNAANVGPRNSNSIGNGETRARTPNNTKSELKVNSPHQSDGNRLSSGADPRSSHSLHGESLNRSSSLSQQGDNGGLSRSSLAHHGDSGANVNRSLSYSADGRGSYSDSRNTDLKSMSSSRPSDPRTFHPAATAMPRNDSRTESRSTPPLPRPDSRSCDSPRSEPRLPTPLRSDPRHTPPHTAPVNSDNKENSREKDLPVLVTHRTKESGEPDRIRTDNRTQPVLSPHSPISSPEDGLIIDCPNTPQKSCSPAPRPERPPSTGRGLGTPVEAIARSPAAMLLSKSSRSPSPAPRRLKTPPTTKSPGLQHSSPVTLQHHSPCEIDDELMDAALML